MYFNINKIFQFDMIESAYFLLEVNADAPEEQFCCYLNEKINLGTCENCNNDKFDNYNKTYKKEMVFDISESYHILASGMKENNGIIIECGNNYLYSCQLYLVYRQEIIAPVCWRMAFFEKELFISSRNNYVLSPFFMTAKSSMNTFCIYNLGKHLIQASIENSPDTKKVFYDKQIIEILPNEMGLITPTFFTKYVRIRISSSYNCIVAKVWYQSQQIK
jgi:hypothetical protein